MEDVSLLVSLLKRMNENQLALGAVELGCTTGIQ